MEVLMAAAAAPKAEKSSRMDIRLTSPQRLKYEKAAAIKGQTLTQWASGHLDRCAERDIAEASTTLLSAEAFDAFCAILDAPMPEATADLLARKPIWS